ncbi:hypothetical protein [Sphingomonas sp. 3-13AW]|uniref:hypothetical protein n=1 Tax=Sphingomonas sp. 3-13AW TaxID=3050450 RepID=UPI003BB53F84
MHTTLASDADILARIEQFCRDKEVPTTTFGRRAIGDGNLVSELRAGKRSLTLKTANRIISFMADFGAEARAA